MLTCSLHSNYMLSRQEQMTIYSLSLANSYSTRNGTSLDIGIAFVLYIPDFNMVNACPLTCKYVFSRMPLFNQRGCSHQIASQVICIPIGAMAYSVMMM